MRSFRVIRIVDVRASFYCVYSVQNWIALRFLLLKSFNSYQKAEYGYCLFCSGEFYLIKRGERKREEKKLFSFFIISFFWHMRGPDGHFFVCCVPIVRFSGMFQFALCFIFAFRCCIVISSVPLVCEKNESKKQFLFTHLSSLSSIPH